MYKVFLLTGNYHSKLVRSSAKYSLGLSCQSYFRRGDLFPLPLLPLFPSPCLANSLFIAISGIYQFQLKNSHGFGNGRARCLPFANTSRLLFLSLSLTARSIYQSVSASVSVSVCLYLCVCSSWIEKAQPENNFSVSWLFNIAFCHAKKEVKHCTQVLRETRDKNAINLPTIPILTPPLSTSSSSHSC